MNYLLKNWESINKDKRELFLKNQILSHYINKELIQFFEVLKKRTKSVNQKLYYLRYCKKIVLQNERLPQKEHYLAFKDEYNIFLRSIKTEQSNNNPIQWLNAEIEYLRELATQKEPSDFIQESGSKQEQKSWLTFKEMLLRLETSKMALRRRMAEGMPFTKFGNQLRFNIKEVDKWLILKN